MADEATVELFEPGLGERVLTRALSRGGDFAELYAERRASFSVSLDDRKVESAQTGMELGAGVRVIAGDATYFGHVDGLAEPDLERVAAEVASAVGRDETRPRPLQAVAHPPTQPIQIRPEEVPAERKAEMLVECDERARAAAAEVVQVTAGYNELRRQVQLANSEGLVSSDDRTRVRLGTQAVARSGDRVEAGSESLAGHAGFELFEGDPASVADEAARRALTMLDGATGAGGPHGGRGRQRLRWRPLPRGHGSRPRVRRGAEACLGLCGTPGRAPRRHAVDGL